MAVQTYSVHSWPLVRPSSSRKRFNRSPTLVKCVAVFADGGHQADTAPHEGRAGKKLEQALPN